MDGCVVLHQECRMREEGFSWGPLARGIYIGLLWLTLVVGWTDPNMLAYYVPLLVFLGLCLKPILVMTGLYSLISSSYDGLMEALWKKKTAQRRMEIDRKERDKKYRHSRIKDSKLPKNW